MISRTDENKKFRLMKMHNIDYISHSYNNDDNKNEIFENNKFTQKEWDLKEFRTKFI